MELDSFDLRVHEEPWNDHVGFAYMGKTESGLHIAEKLTLKAQEVGSWIEPTFHLSTTKTQELFNQLWRLGYRPKDGTGNSGHIEALKYHLEDMRQLVFRGNK